MSKNKLLYRAKTARLTGSGKTRYNNRGQSIRFAKRLCVKAKVTPFGVHGIRALAEHGACLMDVKELLRHRSTQQTDRYLRKQYRKNEAVGILSSITSKAENNGQHSEEKNDASAA